MLCRVKIVRFAGKIRVYINGERDGVCWYGFVGVPAIDYDIELVMGQSIKLTSVSYV